MRWPKEDFASAVFESDLKSLQRLIALVYADHARDGTVAWVTLERLCERTGMKRSSAIEHRKVLVDSGWLVLLEPARQHAAARYRLQIPGVREPNDPLGSEPRDELAQVRSKRVTGQSDRSNTSREFRPPPVSTGGSSGPPHGSSGPRHGSSGPPHGSSGPPHGPDFSSTTTTTTTSAPEISDRMTSSLEEALGMSVPPGYAAKVVADVLATAQHPVRDPVKYVIAAVKSNPYKYRPFPRLPSVSAVLGPTRVADPSVREAALATMRRNLHGPIHDLWKPAISNISPTGGAR